MNGVSAILVSYRTGDVLWEAIAAASGQCDAVVVVDNGNPKEVSAQLKRDARVRYVAAPGNVGFGWGVELGVRAADGDALLVLNPDAVLRPGCVEALVAARAGLTSPAVVGARLVNTRGVEQRGSRRRQLNFVTFWVGRNLHRRPLPDEPTRVGAVSGAAFLMSRADWGALGGFDPGYFLHVEDLDLCRRARDAGGDVVFVPGAEVEHRGATSDVASWVVDTHKAMGFKRYFLTHYPVRGRLAWPVMALALRLRSRRSRSR